MARPTRIDITNVDTQADTMYHTGGATNYLIETPTGVLYQIIRNENRDPAFIKSTDFGMSWDSPVVLKNCTLTQLACWYQRWTDPSGVLGDKIWCCYTDSAVDDVYIRSIDTANADALGTEYVVNAGDSTAAGGALSIAQMRGGNLICCGCIDAGTEVFSRKSTDGGANWADIAAGYEANADLCIVLPGWGADTQDAMMFYYDRSATEVSVKYYDDSGDSWSEASLATSITIPDHTSTTLGHISATVDHTNSANLCAFWTAVDSANADLRIFSCSQAAQTETAANCVLNSTDDQGFAQIAINGTKWICFYFGKTDGTETYNTSGHVYYKISNDAGANWGDEQKLTNTRMYTTLYVLFTVPIFYKNYYISMSQNLVCLTINAPLSIPRATFQLGM